MNIQRTCKNIVSVLVAGALLSACVSAPVQIGPTGNEQYKYDETNGRTVSVKSCGFLLLTFIPIVMGNRYERAYKHLKRQAGGDHIADVRVKEEWTYAFVGTLYCTTMEATAYPKIKD